MQITSLQNPRIKYLSKLRDRRPRDRENRFLIEGYRSITRALANQWPIEEIYTCPELFQGENEESLIEECKKQGALHFETSDIVFRKLAYRDRPEGLIALAPQIHRGLDDLILPERPPLLLIAETIEKPGNLGTILRSADATAVDALILCDARTDLFNPNVVRASTGNLFSVQIAEAGTDETITWLRGRGIRTLAATPHADPLFTDVDLTQPVAIVVGAEQYGLSDAWLEHGDIQVQIPMLGQADSLNVATATALLLYEAVRQRLPKRICPAPRHNPSA